MMVNIKGVYGIDLPANIKATSIVVDGGYVIFLNMRLGPEAQRAGHEEVLKQVRGAT